MLSYRHAFHAGNHADVLKHLILIQVLRYMGQKPAPYWYIDTHAGAGRYSLDTGYATKLAEWKDGVGRLWSRPDAPAAVVDYLDVVRELNPDGKLRHYPGSPWIAYQCLSEADRLRLFELHSSDAKLLGEAFKSAGRRVSITPDDGFAGLKAILPPPPRRAVTLIDPSFETKPDYANVVKGLQEALKRFATGTYLVWYPQLAKVEARQLPDRLKALGAKSWLHATLSVTKPSSDGIGMNGSGMFVINPPWTLAATLQEVLPWLVEVLGQAEGAKYTLDVHED